MFVSVFFCFFMNLVNLRAHRRELQDEITIMEREKMGLLSETEGVWRETRVIWRERRTRSRETLSFLHERVIKIKTSSLNNLSTKKNRPANLFVSRPRIYT
jgi:hypothetical protein